MYLVFLEDVTLVSSSETLNVQHPLFILASKRYELLNIYTLEENLKIPRTTSVHKVIKQYILGKNIFD